MLAGDVKPPPSKVLEEVDRGRVALGEISRFLEPN